MSKRDLILAKRDLKSELVTVEQWGLDIVVRELSARERSESMSLHQEDPMQALCHAIVCGCLDDDGSQLFTSEDIDALAEKSDDALSLLYKKIMMLSGVKIGRDPDEESEAEKPSA